MSDLRRRVVGTLVGDSPESTPDISRDGSPNPEEYKVVQAKQLKQLKSKTGSKRRNFWVFGLGGLFGLVVALFFVSNNDMIDLAAFGDMGLDSIRDVLPAGLINEARDLQVGHSTPLDHSSHG